MLTCTQESTTERMMNWVRSLTTELYDKHRQSYSNLMQHDKLTLSKKRLNRTALLVPAARWRACVQSWHTTNTPTCINTTQTHTYLALKQLRHCTDRSTLIYQQQIQQQWIIRLRSAFHAGMMPVN